MKYAELIIYRAYADLKAEAARGYLGVLWWGIEPVLYLAVFYFLFTALRTESGEGVVAFLLVGLVVWKWFASTIPHGARSIASGVNLMQQVYLPKYVFPCVAAVTNFVKFLIVFLFLLSFLLLAGIKPTAAWLMVPLLIAVQFALTLSLAALLASLVPFLPDLNQIINNVLMLLFFLSGVLFDLSKIPAPYQSFLYLNPMAVLIADYREVLIYGRMPSWMGLAATFGLSSLLWALASWIMRRNDRIYPKVLVR